MKSKLLALLFLSFSLVSCRPTRRDYIIITFLQHTYICIEHETSNIYHYKFENDNLSTNTLKFQKGYQITDIDIEKFQKQIHYKVPPLKYGYYFISEYVYDYDPITKVASNIFEPTELNRDITLHFAVWD